MSTDKYLVVLKISHLNKDIFFGIDRSLFEENESNYTPVEIVRLVKIVKSNMVTCAWDKYGCAWGISNLNDDHIWERMPKYDREEW
ncbi:MAG: hypothetical protein ACTSR2_00175 [Candidatus Hodarchaeales archaeon]